MESYASFIDEGWMNLSSMFSCDQDSSHFADNQIFSGEHDHDLDLQTSSILWGSPNKSNNNSNSNTIDEHVLVYASDHDLKPTFYNYISQESSNATDTFLFCNSETPTDNWFHQSKDQYMMEGDSSNFLFLAQVFSDDEEIPCLKQDNQEVENGQMENSVPIKEASLKRKYKQLEVPNILEDEGSSETIENRKKKTRVARDNKNKKNLPPKNQKIEDGTKGRHQNDEIITNKDNGKGNITQIYNSSCSEDDSNSSQDINEEPINVTANIKAGRGAATDPQSVYARKRRERINEKLKILQNIVPNGTKVDISTMLEEAVHYVKFLQLQIKLLSSDDKWMYAPIAYNGMDMGLYQNLSHNL